MIERPDEEHPGERLSAYLDGELPRDERDRIEAHLSSCPACRVLAQDFRMLATAARREPFPPVPDGLQGRIRAAIEIGSTRRGVTRRPGGIASYSLGLAAAATVLLTLGLWALRREIAPAGPVQVPGPVVTDLEKTPPPPASRNSEEDDTRAQLRSLGYAGAEQDAGKAPAAPPRMDRQVPRQGAPGGAKSAAAAPEQEKKNVAPEASRVEERDGSSAGVPSLAAEPSSPARGDLAPAPAAKPEQAMSNGERNEAGTAATGAMAQSAMRGAPVRRLVIEYPAYRVSIFDDGMIVLSAPEYQCAAHRPGLDPDLRALFGLATSAAGKERAGAGPAPSPAVAVRLEEAPESSGIHGSRALPAGTAAEIGARLKLLMREKYLTFLEERCGEAPRAVRSD